MPDALDIVIVNWNAGPRLRECLASLVPAIAGVESGVRVVVVDNASTDGSLEGIEAFGLPLTVIRNPQNRGFAVACNQGAQRSRSRLLLFLNPDTRLDSRSLGAPITFLDAPDGADVGIVGIQLVDDQGRVAKSCSRFPTPRRLLARALGLDQVFPGFFPGMLMHEWDHASTRQVDQVMGAFLLVRRDVYRDLGGFDERFFVYFEDVDLCRRALDAGWKTIFVSEARAFHGGHGSSDQVRARRLFYSLRSRLLYMDKHFDLLGALSVAVATLVFEPLARIARAVSRGSAVEVRETLVGYALLWRI